MKKAPSLEKSLSIFSLPGGNPPDKLNISTKLLGIFAKLLAYSSQDLHIMSSTRNMDTWHRTAGKSLKPEVLSEALLLAWLSKAGVNSRVFNFHRSWFDIPVTPGAECTTPNFLPKGQNTHLHRLCSFPCSVCWHLVCWCRYLIYQRWRNSSGANFDCRERSIEP